LTDEDGKSVAIATTERDITELKQNQIEIQKSLIKLRKTIEETIVTVARIVDVRDPYTAGHQKRVASISVAIAQGLGLTEEQIRGIYLASLIHDIGKIQVPAEILSKPGKLTKLEFALIKIHPRVGYDLLKGIDFPWPIAQIVYQHHERIDGSGYPRKLKGDKILLEARIVGIADVIEAISSHRPYRPALGIDFALEEVKKHSGITFDTAVVKSCMKIFKNGYQLEKP
jgi:HD-GYP domain-containing protein (c-di-GMP phosphodiesterase class II)